MLRRIVYNSRGLDQLARALRGGLVVRCQSVHNKADGELSASKNAAGGSSGFQVGHCDIEREISLFGPKDYRAPLPGNVGLCPRQQEPHRQEQEAKAPSLVRSDAFSDVLAYELPSDRHLRLVREQVLSSPGDESSEEMREEQLRRAKEVLEVVAHQCPELLVKDFQELFPGRRLDRNTTVITICQRSKADMASWSPLMEVEREELMEHFIQLAQELCDRLANQGHFCDYIDPFSGRPALGPYTPATLFETDERYRKLGFEIEDLGCCKVTRHHRWGSHSFVGCVITSAPINSGALTDLLRILSSAQD